MGGIVITKDQAVAEWLRGQSGKPGSDVGREIPHDELVRYAPKLADAVAAFEPADHVLLFATTAPVRPTRRRRKKAIMGFGRCATTIAAYFCCPGRVLNPASWARWK